MGRTEILTSVSISKFRSSTYRTSQRRGFKRLSFPRACAPIQQAFMFPATSRSRDRLWRATVARAPDPRPPSMASCRGELVLAIIGDDPRTETLEGKAVGILRVESMTASKCPTQVLITGEGLREGSLGVEGLNAQPSEGSLSCSVSQNSPRRERSYSRGIAPTRHMRQGRDTRRKLPSQNRRSRSMPHLNGYSTHVFVCYQVLLHTTMFKTSVHDSSVTALGKLIPETTDRS